jgi:hypothetical protein
MTISSKASHLESLALRKKTYAPSADAKLSLNAPRLVNLRYPNPFTFPTPEERKDALKLHPTRGAASNKSFGTAKKKKPSNFWTDNVASKDSWIVSIEV